MRTFISTAAIALLSFAAVTATAADHPLAGGKELPAGEHHFVFQPWLNKVLLLSRKQTK